MKTRFIGDVHGKFSQYVEIVNSTPYPTIQVGDYGMGFVDVPYDSFDPEKDLFIRGNHDNPAMCRSALNWIPDGHFDGEIFHVGGAASIDRYRRTEGKDWWADEELDMGEFYSIMDRYEAIKPNIVVSHDGPMPIIHYIMGHHTHDNSRTQQALTSLLHIHRPKLWIFGHHHKSFDETYEGCRFICLAELEYIDIELDNYR